MKLGTHLLKGFDLLWVAVFGLGLGCALAVGVVCFGERSRKSLYFGFSVGWSKVGVASARPWLQSIHEDDQTHA